MAPATSQPDGRAARWAGQHERRRGEFVDAALAAIAEHGPEVSTEQIAERAGVARTRLYKHFTDAADLQNAIADRVVELITADLAPLWNPSGSPAQMINAVIEAHVNWLSEHGHLYRYLTLNSLSARATGRDAFTDVKTAIARHLTALFEHYMAEFDVRTSVSEPMAFALVGLVDSVTDRWLVSPSAMRREQLIEQLATWVWQLIDGTLRDHRIELDPHSPLATPDLTGTPQPPRAAPQPEQGTTRSA